MDSGVAARPIADMDAYEEKLSQYIYRTGLLMKPVYDRARADRKRVVYAEGEEYTVLRAVQTAEHCVRATGLTVRTTPALRERLLVAFLDRLTR